MTHGSDQTRNRPAVLIANRGEIAVRIIEAVHRVGADAILAVSEADKDSLGAQRADRVIVIGPARAQDSYLKAEIIAQAAVQTGADAVHPGYGFLSEQPELPEMLEELGIAFVGPRAETIRSVGDKASARKVAVDAGVPVAAAHPLVDTSDEGEIRSAGDSVGYPLLVKAVYGGGGRGIRLTSNQAELLALVPQAAAEAGAAFGHPDLYLERYYGSARHVEVQVFGDGQGQCWIFGDRDCSVQRRHQKLIEECPAPHLSDEQRSILHQSSRSLVETLQYRGAGTVEFLVDTQSDDVVFLEVNARIQVEHPVTEEAFGVDLVAAQLRLALGLELNLEPVGPVPDSCALEVRINAEDTSQDFRPSPGRLGKVTWPRGPGIRVETHIYDGYLFPPHYDSLMAKLIVRARTRDEAVAAMASAVSRVSIDGVPTTLPLHGVVMAQPEFIRGGMPTTWFEPLWKQHSKDMTEND